MNLIINARLVTEKAVIPQGWLIYDSQIIDFGCGQLPEKYQGNRIIDAQNNLLLPGFIDVHLHGGDGVDVMSADKESLQQLGLFLATHGTTSYLAATVTASWNSIYSALDIFRDTMLADPRGARLLGAHLEGPFINPTKKGAHNEAHICPPNADRLEAYWDLLRIISYAPETDLNHKFLKNMTKNHPSTVLSAGHTNADYQTIKVAVQNGLRSATHFFNAMPALHHRQLNATSALLESNIFYELIADNVHVNPYWYWLLGEIKGFDKMILITDAISAAGLGDGETSLGGLDVIVQNGEARLKSNGSLAGSVLTLDRALANVADHTNLDIPSLIRLVTLNPARLLRIEDEVGSIARLKRADLVICDDNMTVRTTIVAGKTVYQEDERVS